MEDWTPGVGDVFAWEMSDLVEVCFVIGWLINTDVVYGESRAVGELASLFDLVVAEIIRRIDLDDWRSTGG